MTPLDRKLFRDLWGLKSQALAVASVMACGLAMMIMARSLILSIETARDNYYRDYRFAQVFAQLKRAPMPLREELAKIPGIGTVQTSIAMMVTLDLPDMAEPAMGLIQSLPEHGELQLNRVHLRRGRMLVGPAGHDELLVSEAFAEAHGLQPGDRIAAILYGRKQTFRIAGIVLSPEYVYEALPGVALPDNRSFGVFWMPYKELATATELYGAFNKVELTLAPGASARAVIAAVDRLLEPYGGRGAYARQDHYSHMRLNDEIRTLTVLSIGFPLVFLSVAAFMVSSVMNRQITMQRGQIAVLKACGFSNRQVGWHYLKFALVIVVVGAGLGVLGGIVLGHRLVDMYHVFFRFPALHFLLDSRVVAIATGLSALAAIAGVWGSVRAAVRLPPAQAMRPEPPASYRPSFLERTAFGRRFPASLRMALRNIERRPLRALLTSVALALATGILVVPNAINDGIDYVLNFQWDLIQRHTVMLSLNEPGPPRALADLRSLPGVVRAEPFRAAAVEFRNGSRTRLINVVGLPSDATLDRVLDSRSRRIALPPHGLVISAKLGEVLGVKPGDPLVMRVLEGRRPQLVVPVAEFCDDFAGVTAYLDMAALNRALGEGDRISGAYLTVADGQWREFLRKIKETPKTRSVVIKAAMRASFRQSTEQLIGVIRMIYLVFATVVAFGIVYNSTRIALSESQRELATLRVIGFTQGEVGAVLADELVLLTLAALPVGLLLGSVFAAGIVTSINTEFVRLPLVFTAANYAYAVMVVALASLLSVVLACRYLNRLDLVGVLKAAE
ncbi:MAG: FtsX-like permease family protein [Opitutaceae bacterium]|nr:FtsX-like permease family protein [Opitutaceae bacterium]